MFSFGLDVYLSQEEIGCVLTDTRDVWVSHVARMSTLRLGTFGTFMTPMVLQATAFIDKSGGRNVLQEQWYRFRPLSVSIVLYT